MKKGDDLKERTKHFALRIIRLFGSLPITPEGQVLGKQLLRETVRVKVFFELEIPPMRASFYRIKWSSYYAYYLENCRIILRNL